MERQKTVRNAVFFNGIRRSKAGKSRSVARRSRGMVGIVRSLGWAALYEPPCADFVASAALYTLPCAEFVAAAVVCEPSCADFPAGTVLCESPCADFVRKCRTLSTRYSALYEPADEDYLASWATRTNDFIIQLSRMRTICGAC